MIEHYGARDEPDDSILYILQTVEIAQRQTTKHRIAVNKACDDHCKCVTG